MRATLLDSPSCLTEFVQAAAAPRSELPHAVFWGVTASVLASLHWRTVLSRAVGWA